MPNKAKYLDVNAVETIIKLREKEQPRKIAEKYQIGLRRLYKIWIDASNDKRFPGGFAGTAAGRHLTEQIEYIQNEIDERRTEYEKLQQRLDEYNKEINARQQLLKQKQTIIAGLVGSIQQTEKK